MEVKDKKRKKHYDDRKKIINYKDLDNPQLHERYWGPKHHSPSPELKRFVGKRYYDEEKIEDKKRTKLNEEKIGNRYYPDEKNNENEPRKRKNTDMLTTKTGGAYIPPAKLKLMQAELTDKSSAAFQRLSWEALKKSINGFINKVNISNLRAILKCLLQENIIRGRGLLCKTLIQAQAASPTYTHVYAALIAVINSKFPNIGELLLKRLVLQFKRGFRRNDKTQCITSVQFIAHLINQRVAHEILALEILTLLVETSTDDSVEVAIAFLKECGQKLTDVSSKGINAIFEMLRHILHEGSLDKRVQYMIEVMFQIRKDGFKDHPAVLPELDIIEEDDQFTHLITLDEVTNGEEILNVFKLDENYEDNENKYKVLSNEILGEDSSSDGSDGSEGDDSDDEEEGSEVKDNNLIIDNTETNLIVLRRTIYLTIQSSLDFEECAHKLMKLQLKPGQEIELCHMFIDACAEKRTYEKFYGLLAERFCKINKIYVAPFEQIFADFYATAHRQVVDKLRSVAKLFAHLFYTDAISWQCMSCIQLNEEDTTSSGRIFIKILFQELAEFMGMTMLNDKLKNLILPGLFPMENPKNTRFAINFFTSIGLGGLTDQLREHIKTLRKTVQAETENLLNNKSISSSSSSSNSSSSSSSGSSSSSSDSSSSSSDSTSSESEENSKISKKTSKNKISKKSLSNKSKNSDKKKKTNSDSSDNDDERNKKKDKHTSQRGELKNDKRNDYEKKREKNYQSKKNEYKRKEDYRDKKRR